MTGYVPSLEAYSFVATEAEEGQAWLKGRRQVPLGFGWLKTDESPYDELPMRVNRIAYREFSRNPDLTFERFKEKLGQGGLRGRIDAATRRGSAGTPGGLRHGADVVPAIAGGLSRAGSGDEGPGD